MSYSIQAIIAGMSAADSEAFAALRVVPLPQGLVMAPLTEQVRVGLGLAFCPLTDEGERPQLPATVIELLRRCSRPGRAVYVEAESWGGTGLQACLFAEAGEIVDSIYVNDDAINAALAFLGVTVGDSHDEFDAVNLGAHRSTEEWIGDGLTKR